MSKVTIVTDRRNRWGTAIKVPILGKIDIPADGRMEVEEQVAEMLVKTSVGWAYASGDAPAPPKKESKKEEAPKVEEAPKTKEVQEVVEEAPKVAEVLGQDEEEIEEKVEEEKEEDQEEEVEEVVEESKEEDIDLSTKKFKELQEVAESAGLSHEEWGTIKSKKGMIEYLEGKIG